MNGSNRLTSKVFETLRDAVHFSNTRVGVQNLFEIIKVD
jgi:hypothetical protein